MSELLTAWLSSPLGKAIKSYKGAAIIPLYSIIDGKCTCGKLDCKSAGKHPFTRNGLKDASKDIEQIAAIFNYRSDLNVGMVTGEISETFVLDVDPKNNGFESLDELIKTYGELPPTIIVETGSGGYHIWFNNPEGLIVNNRTGFRNGLDIRGINGYVVMPPSNHVSGKVYKFIDNGITKTADAPAWLIEMIQIKNKKVLQPLLSDHSTGAHSKWDIDEVRKMLDAINPDSPYSEWLEIGMAIHSGGFSLSLWDSWSRQGTKYQNGDCESRWRGFNPAHGVTMGTLVHMAELNGWRPSPVEREPVDVSNIMPLVKKATALKKEKNEPSKPVVKENIPQPYSLGFNALEIPGLIGDTVRWITKYSLRKQPELALFNTIAFAGAIFGRKYMSPANTRTNLYMIGIADTGAGKDHSRKSIKDLAHAAGLDGYIGSDAIRSDSGMLRGLMNNPSQIMMIDEFGLFLQGIANEKSPHYIRSQVSILLKLYSSSNSVYNHGDYSDPKLTPIIINSPALSIYGTSTEAQYAKSLKKSAIESGEINRFVSIKARNSIEYPDRDMPLYKVDAKLQEKWSDFAAKFGDPIGVLADGNTLAPDPILIPWGECDDIQYQIVCRGIDKSGVIADPLRHLWGRMYENTVKIAMIFAIARNKDNPRFISDDFNIAQLIVESSIEYLSNIAANSMSETVVEENNNEFISAIKESGGSMSKADIARKFRKLKPKERDEIINSLIDQEVIEVEKDTSTKRPTTIYKLIVTNTEKAA